MLKKTITYKNLFTDEEVAEEHYFHISKAELIEMEVETPGGMQKRFEQISKPGPDGQENGPAVMEFLQDILRRSYLRREGDRPIKSKEIWEEFRSSQAYAQFFYELCTDTELAAEFVNRVFPQLSADDLAKAQAVAKKIEEEGGTPPKLPTAEELGIPAEAKVSAALEPKDPTGLTEHPTPRVLTQAEVEAMDYEELKSGLATGRYKLS